MSVTSLDLEQLGFELADHGLAGRDVVIRQVVRLARAHGVGGVAVDVLADTAAPDVARLRAFAAVSAKLAKVAGDEQGRVSVLAPVA